MATGLPTGIKVNELFQAGIVVRNIEKSMKLYGDLFGIDSWVTMTIDDKIAKLTYCGKPSRHTYKAAMAMVGALMLELLEPLEGRGTYRDHLEKHGEGLHHLGHMRVANLDEAVRAMEKAGFPAVEGGDNMRTGEWAHKWAYIDTTSALGYIVEFSQGSDPRDAFQRRQKEKAAGKG